MACRCADVSLEIKSPRVVSLSSRIELGSGVLVFMPTDCAKENGDRAMNARRKILYIG